MASLILTIASLLRQLQQKQLQQAFRVIVRGFDLIVRFQHQLRRPAAELRREPSGRLHGLSRGIVRDTAEPLQVGGVFSVVQQRPRGADPAEVVPPVSYTHLDVYKRQIKRWPMGLFPILLWTEIHEKKVNYEYP